MAKINYYLKRPVEKLSQTIVRKIARGLLGMCFDMQIRGKENLPKTSAILMPNHCIGLDGFILGAYLPRQTHFWVQNEGVYNANPLMKFLLWSFGEIPINVDNQRDYPAVLNRTYDYLRYTDDFIGIFPEGPTKNLRDRAGKVIPLEKREYMLGAIHAALKSKKLLVPIGISTRPEIADELWEMEGKVQQKLSIVWEYAKKNGKIPYNISIGAPLIAKLAENNRNEQKAKLKETLKKEIVRLATQKY